MPNKRRSKRDTVRFRIWLRKLIYDSGSNLTRFGETYGNEYGFCVRDVMRWSNGSNMPAASRLYSLAMALSELTEVEPEEIIVMMVRLLHTELRKK